MVMAISLGWWVTGTSVAEAGQVSDMDRQFAMQAASDGRAEVHLGTMATERAAHPEVQ
jgi:hypothetical protein